MRVHYTLQALDSLSESLDFRIRKEKLPGERARQITAALFRRGDGLVLNPEKGQKEEWLSHLEEGHRRVIEGRYKIVYYIDGGTIVVTDFFDTNRDPAKMKG